MISYLLDVEALISAGNVVFGEAGLETDTKKSFEDEKQRK
jgi:hypothetical protein